MPAPTTSAEHAADSSVVRAALRAQKLDARLALPDDTRREFSSRIEGHLIALLAPLGPRVIAFCAPVRGEFDAQPLVAGLMARGWRAAMPVVAAPEAAMRFLAWSPASPMTRDRHGIPVPAAGDRVVPDVVLLPLVAFDAQGFRLGYGGGYFDRTLASLVPRPLAVGVGFELARVPDIRPLAHDIRLDATVTEAGVRRHGAPRAGVLASGGISVNHGAPEEPQ